MMGIHDHVRRVGVAACLLAASCGGNDTTAQSDSRTGGPQESDAEGGSSGEATNGTTGSNDDAGPGDPSGADEGTETGSADSTGGDDGPYPGEPPEHYCPGDPSGICDDPDGPVRAGAAVRSIVPNCFESWTDEDGNGNWSDEPFADCGCDRLCPGDPGYTAADEGEGDGSFQRIYIAGFGSNRPARGVRGAAEGLLGEGDGIWSRALVLERGDVSFALVTLDIVGLFQGDVAEIRSRLQRAGVAVDYVLVHSIHNHEGPDTMGLWGSDTFSSGYDQDYREQLIATAVEVVRTAWDERRELGSVVIGEVDASTYDAERGVANVLNDTRDPWVVDPMLGALWLKDAEGATIATVVQWASHPETLGARNTLLSADYPHALRRTLEVGSSWTDGTGRDGVGGPCLFVSGALGGMMTTLGVEVSTPDGMTYAEENFERADAIGMLLGEMALDALDSGREIPASELPLRWASQSFPLVVANEAFKLAFATGVLQRTTQDTPEGLAVTTEMGLVDIGPLRLLTVPGELLPEIAVGGYDATQIFVPGQPLVDVENPNPPNIAAAPAGPYLKDRLRTGTAEFTWIVGLGNDQLGYIIPEYDFELHPLLPYFNEADGDHYEETNSTGPKTAALVETQADALIEFGNWLAD